MGSHNGAERIDNSLSHAKSAVFSQSQEEIFGELIHLQLVTGRGQALGLQTSLNGGIRQEIGQPLILLQRGLESLEVFFNSVQGLLFGGGGEECGGIATFGAKNLNWRLNELKAAN